MTNSQELEDLAWSLEASQGEFKLILARCNYLNLQNQLIQELQRICDVEISILCLQTAERTLYNAIKEEFNDEIQALTVVGWESLPNLSQMLISANQVREEFRNNCKYPVVLWINDQIYQQIMESATDLESWGITINFTIPIQELINFLKLTIEKILNNDLNINLTEVELALQDLQKFGQDLATDFQANCNFLHGFIEYNNKQLDMAINYYQQSLDFWQTTDNFEIQGKILYNLTLCNYEKYKPNPLTPFPTKEGGEIRDYIQQTLERFKNAKRLDLIANSLSRFGLILQALQAWEQLKILSQRALEIHQAENNILKIAEDYIFLATANFEQSNFQEVAKMANQGLNVFVGLIHELPLPNNQSEYELNFYHQSLLFILAEAQEKLQQYKQAIKNLKLARDIGVTNNQPKLYVKILNLLQQLLFTQKEYLEAFNTKLKCRSIEQQFGLRAFIGAGWLKPAKITPIETFHGTSLQSNTIVNKKNISPEIEASGRRIDVDNLLERIGRPDKRIIVIHGQSGVGKSSLVNAGLIPALENKAIGFQDNLPVTIRVYKSWFTELIQQVLNVLPDKLKPEDLKLETQEDFISKLQEIGNNNLRLILIFDQFEEFFFVCDHDQQRKEFFKFLGECLNILSLKVILSLRIDYLHLLLDCNKLESMKIISQDILSKEVLYELGNLTPDNAKLTIKRLTKETDFQLDNDLIDRLVQDLAVELDAVRPIELQVVGAQLQTENIRTLAAYQQCGNKQHLVKRYLDEVVNDCGIENKEAAELLLYLLTDEQGTRPLKTKAELERDLKSLAAVESEFENNLDLVLDIFVKSGLVVLLPENPFERYQLVHDYLALFIRKQQEPKLKAVMEELEKERKQRQLKETELEQAEAAKNILVEANKKAKQRIGISSGIMAISLVLGGIAAVLAMQAFHLSNEAQTGSRLERQGITAWQQFQRQEIEPLLSAMAAGQEVKKLVKDGRPLEKYPAASPQLALQTILDNIHEKNQLKGHTSTVYNASFSPDGKTIVTASGDNTARVWDVSGKVLAELKGHTSPVYNASFSPDGKTIVTASGDNTARIWDVSGKVLAKLKGHTSYVNNASFSPDGKTIVTASDDNTARVWDVSGKVLAELKGHNSYVNNASFSPDGKTIVTASGDNTARVWDVSGKVLAELKGHTSPVYNASFSPDGKTIVTASGDNTVRVWDISGKVLAELKGHTSPVNNASFSPDGKTIVTASGDNTARVWQADRLDQLLSRGCQWLNDYLVTNPKELEKLQVCQNQSNLVAAAPFLVKVGEEEARTGNIDNAVATFHTAFKWQPSLTFDPQAKAKKFATKGKAERLIIEGESNVKQGKVKEAIATYAEAQKTYPQLEITADSWHTLCRYASLNKQAASVIFACDKAVKLSPDDGNIRDSRGLARALTGDYQGAINDFEAYIKWTGDKDNKAQRQGWVKDLKFGKNPFTDEVLKELLQ